SKVDVIVNVDDQYLEQCLMCKDYVNIANNAKLFAFPSPFFATSVSSCVVDGRRVAHSNEIASYLWTDTSISDYSFLALTFGELHNINRIDLHRPLDMMDTYFVGGSVVDWPLYMNHARLFNSGQQLKLSAWRVSNLSDELMRSICSQDRETDHSLR